MKSERKTIDINCDLGEGVGNDEAIMRYISSANIACGYHAGDANTMKQTVQLCKKYNVAVGAHPSFPDKPNFGRTDMTLHPGEIYEMIVKQINYLEKIAEENDVPIHHVKPHGALYNMTARDKALAPFVALAILDTNPKYVLYGLSGSYLVKEGKHLGVNTANEVFADRTYKDDGSLTSRAKPGALIEDPDKAVAQVLQMVKEGTVTSIAGKKIPIIAETVCIHGDGDHAVEFAKAIHAALIAEGVEIRAR
ncbi:MAG TPA: 5-oxoprolinase subunit PxpA [Chitinophagaceae bacterium]|nr:5-oxoprolinase subunit PxpA [Chitinophagaceae bacterium]